MHSFGLGNRVHKDTRSAQSLMEFLRPAQRTVMRSLLLRLVREVEAVPASEHVRPV